ncbi:RNA polymerase sigma factor [Actinoalloteichus hymeniacidonis]|uniref:RNA polymerase sigma factor, sigma-70 family n=1 Tax=Actinoalloteichus hymeniacidonis TaxID=340345 RepID=A0AAC9MX50_9PSEU|nr:sigma-70 family RNA polymerase sigma factor [Actinoalloteichus hymeniacidonis]AOS61666.1 RNA polymerase sigma factor, sigma-70 family [Actinoalloteichus hymeniacidonis]MBB5910320.1 RNA polymerase sigma-70 factor (ECF subfamily) [Actinoalloteichus hymeniacidonis]
MTAEQSETEFARISHDQQAFERFYRAHVEAVQRFVARRVDDPHLAADLTAEVFLAVIDSAHTYRPGRGSATGWLFGVARNVVSSERRRRARGLVAASRIAGRALADEDDIAALVDRIDAAASSRTLMVAMERLADGERAVLELTALDGLSVADAALALGITSVAARVRLHRARKRMRHHLDAGTNNHAAPNKHAGTAPTGVRRPTAKSKSANATRIVEART